MAEKRMLSKSIINSDKFLSMPLSAQALYLHLSINADDDGFINSPNRIQKLIGARTKDLKALIDSGFLICFESGVVVITHWQLHNYIRKDRYKPTIYKDEKATLQIRENGMYSVGMFLGIPNDNQMDTQNRIDKDRIDKKSIEIDREIDNQSSYQSSASPSPCGGSASQYNKVNKLVEYYNSNCGSMKKVAVITEEIEIKVNVFLSMHGMDKFYELMERAAKSDFLNGKCESTWKADIVWLLTPNNADKVLEGKYDTYNKNKEKVSSKNIVNSQHEESDEMTEEERERIYRELTE